jgi:hypothetical protein
MYEILNNNNNNNKDTTGWIKLYGIPRGSQMKNVFFAFILYYT